MFQLQLFISILTLSFSTQSYSSTSQLSIIQSHKPNPLYVSVIAFGATGNGSHYDTLPIQRAINACSAAVSEHCRQCHVIFPPGKYLTATIFLKSGVVLDIHRKATILGGPKLEDYPKEQSRWYVVVAEDAVDVGITGGGEINGQGLKFVERFDEKKNVMVSWNHSGACLGDECRPRLVGFIGCRNVKVNHVRLIEPALWCLHVVRSDNTAIRDVMINGNFNSPNNDGIDIEDSNNTVVTRCNINTGDDAICPKSSTGPVYNLTVTDCWIRTKSSAIKLGSASFHTFKNFLFDNITIVESHRGLALQIRDGGNVSDLTFSNINMSTRYYHPSWWGRAEPIYVTTCPRDANSKAGSISNLLFVNITATSENGIFLSGSGGGVLGNLKFINMNLIYKRWTKFPDGLVDYRPGCQQLVKHQTAGFMMENINGLVVENVVMKWSNNESMRWNNPLDFRPSTVNNISLINFYSRSYQQ
ncbi:probable polygalacturonase [Lycium ferocissimum]|uniref:probable polygalacturonase n=1 Tax=Lycium ferocissimum TaxID=112874 RepID=UPI002815EEEE|nr:probable polygalacturonase [Lycium ferocissimum]